MVGLKRVQAPVQIERRREIPLPAVNVAESQQRPDVVRVGCERPPQGRLGLVEEPVRLSRCARHAMRRQGRRGLHVLVLHRLRERRVPQGQRVPWGHGHLARVPTRSVVVPFMPHPSEAKPRWFDIMFFDKRALTLVLTVFTAPRNRNPISRRRFARRTFERHSYRLEGNWVDPNRGSDIDEFIRIRGAFYGPAGQEAAGTFLEDELLDTTDRNSWRGSISGAFGVRRVDEPEQESAP